MARTVTENMGAIATSASTMPLRSELGERVVGSVRRLLDEVESRPKGVGWRLRARVGDRLAWREEPEELDK